MTKRAIVVIGSSSAIAQAFIATQAARDPNMKILTISRSSKAPFCADTHDKKENCSCENCSCEDTHFKCDYSPEQVAQVVNSIRKLELELHSVTIFNGVLHQGTSQYPEKKLEDLNLKHSMALFEANTMLPMLWMQALLPALKGKHKCVFTALSARVGSISDNHLGGWYSYRSSKAALNMMFKSAAVELARRAKNIKLVLFHPGTTDTPLSKPFQANVPAEKLFQPEFVARQLSKIISNIEVDGTVSYLDWQNKKIEW
ncbi:SDR family NAD(P)-dependent oxidoreductase [Pseudoalteromonas piscicida]|uniref:SDR family NAD(P)-dependent oxidoreductase n=1 Tax=Pseudoalteromonas piscicida TaxID=43662 RepID=UPI0030B45353